MRRALLLIVCLLVPACAVERPIPPQVKVVKVKVEGPRVEGPTTVIHAEEDELKRAIVASSIQSYLDGGAPCPCPESRRSDDHRCGLSSAYCAPNGQKPLCYTEDVSAEMVSLFRFFDPTKPYTQPSGRGPIEKHDVVCQKKSR